MKRTARPLFALLLLGLVLGGCGASENGDLGGEPPDYARALAGSPAPLAALYDQANELLPGGVDAYEGRIVALRGYPAVVNVWASWCIGCREEHESLLQYKESGVVPIYGLNYKDKTDDALGWLKEAVRLGFINYPFFTRVSFLEPLRGDADYEALMQQVERRWQAFPA